LVDPRLEVIMPKIGKREHQVGEVAFRVDQQRGNPVERRFLEQRQAQPGLAASSHPDADRVRDEILRVVEDEGGQELLARQIEAAPEVEDAELLEVAGVDHAPRQRLRRAQAAVGALWSEPSFMIASSASWFCRRLISASGSPSTRRRSARYPGLIWPSSPPCPMISPPHRVAATSVSIGVKPRTSTNSNRSRAYVPWGFQAKP